MDNLQVRDSANEVDPFKVFPFSVFFNLENSHI
jgi:hypothetical protein